MKKKKTLLNDYCCSDLGLTTSISLEPLKRHFFYISAQPTLFMDPQHDEIEKRNEKEKMQGKKREKKKTLKIQYYKVQ